MSRDKRLVLVTAALVLAATSLLTPRSAHAYCIGWGEVTWPSIPVRLHAELHNQMKHSDGTTWTRAELERAVRIVLARVNDSAGADIPLLYLDGTVAPPSCQWLDSDCDNSLDVGASCGTANVVTIVPSNCNLTQVFPAGGGFVVEFQASESDAGPKPWDHSSGAGEVFERVLAHELGHVLGLSHPNGCATWSSVCPSGSNPCATMMGDSGGTRSEEYFMPDDRNGLRAIYGARTPPTERQFESNNLDTGVVEWGVGQVDASDFFAVSSNPTPPASSLTLAGYRRDVSGSPIVYSWNWSNFAMTSLGHPWDHYANGPLGAAQSNVYQFVTSSSYRGGTSSRKWRRQVTTSYRPIDGGSGWTTVKSNPSPGSLGDTVTAGISSVYNTNRAAILHAYRASDGEILLQAGTSGGTPFETNVYSEGTPSITCAPISGLDCIVVSTEPGFPRTSSTAPRLRWFRASWNSVAGWTLGSLQTEPWIMHSGDPQVAVYRNGSVDEYVVTYRWQLNSVNRVSMLRMNAASGSSFGQWSSLPSTSGVKTHVASGSTRDLEVFYFSQ